jgi:hypothetical protein
MVPFKHRKDMKKKDAYYEASICKKSIAGKKKSVENNSKKSPPFARIPIERE